MKTHYNKRRNLNMIRMNIPFVNIRFVLTALLATILIAMIAGNSIQAEGSSTPEYKYYKSITIESGDTIWSIAQQYMDDDYLSVNDYIEEVEAINDISSDKITAGNSIIIPYYSIEKH